jgi:hypothetical protein
MERELLPLAGALLLPPEGALFPLDGGLLPPEGALLPLDGGLLPLDGGGLLLPPFPVVDTGVLVGVGVDVAELCCTAVGVNVAVA